MGILSTAAFTIRGGWDIFDRANGLIGKLREAVMAADDEDYPIEFNPGGGLFQMAPQFAGGKENILAELDEAKRKIDEVCLACQEVMASLP